ncbi:hypothetical protein BKP45_12370 [Anaerobacillus alkalidiazotrophicus]|uniref:Type 4 fimbrial biogenesis protein PilX N-terminal domain-containing protein n=1 Tax=Anaerobacillus alkalidiazotrophicus TaxID=472963 RepID=A0A1S2M182_9BACI|nr:type II secretion system protein [Anaerobacillus alkalidiazotrophicus]OIJ18364.1 hypothetical protein BKP45_18085 [Anaerobacillus alkalidiazotrophicus]OIJ19843.1 hypothetical protein BKP45_12370 [Anaerobacillus alkalidiazotrophicus]
MKRYFNNRGYTLIIVLLTIVLISLFSLMLIPKALSTSLQVNKSEGMAQAKDLSEMGIHYAHAYFENIVNLAIEQAKADPGFINQTVNHDLLFCENFISLLPIEQTFAEKSINNSAYYYKVSFEKEVNDFFTNCSGFQEIILPIESIGKVDNNSNSEKLIRANFVVENEGEKSIIGPCQGEICPPPPPPENLPFNIINTEINLSGQTVSNYIYTSPKFTQSVVLAGNSRLIVGGNAWVSGSSLRFNGNNAELIVGGNAYFTSPIDFRGNGNKICIRGTAYLYDHIEKKWNVYDVPQFIKSCSGVNEIGYFYDINQWKINEDIDVYY